MTSRPKRTRRGLRWPLAWGIGIVLGAIAAVAAGWWVSAQPESATSAAGIEPGDRLTAAIESLEKDGFYVAPELRTRLNDAQLKAIRRAVTSSETPVYLAYMTNATDAGYYQNYNAVDIIADHIGEDGLYAIVDERLDASETSRGVGFPYVSSDALLGRPQVALERYAQEIAHAPEEDLAVDSDHWGGAFGGAAAGTMFGAAGFGALLAIVWATGRLRRSA